MKYATYEERIIEALETLAGVPISGEPPSSPPPSGGPPSSPLGGSNSAGGSNYPNRLGVLTFLATQWQGEQEHFWTRFAGMAALHAGLFVIAVQLPPLASAAIAVLGFLCGLLWCAIQLRSKHYVDRWKPMFHLYRRRLGLLWRGEDERNLNFTRGSSFASTSFGLAAPVAILFCWNVVFVVAICNCACQLEQLACAITR